MTYIDKNEALLAFLTSDKVNIIDATISRFDIFYSNDQLNIDVYIILILKYSQGNRELKLQFQNVNKYCLFYSSDTYFYYIERYKFFKCDKGFYISFDPYEDNLEIQPEDNDFILSTQIEGYFL